MFAFDELAAARVLALLIDTTQFANVTRRLDRAGDVLLKVIDAEIERGLVLYSPRGAQEIRDDIKSICDAVKAGRVPSPVALERLTAHG